ncbi:MAG TPA: DNA damage-inducible protein D [Ktedonobacteraceae bacterium]|nr:DNA damage-inducible protein D [Ktedonobacteraceae bacterium]
MHSPHFDLIKQKDAYGVEFCSARDLMPFLGYGKKWQKFSSVIKKAIAACTKTGSIVEDHFAKTSTLAQPSTGRQHSLDDYTLSRFACYLIAQNGDPRKPEIAAAQAYFAASTRAHEIHQLRAEQEAHLEKRLEVSESFKALGRAAQNAGVESESFGIFIDAGYLGLHRHTRKGLKELKGIPENEEYLDRITRKELSAIDFKNIQTEDKLISENIIGQENAIQTHYFVGDQVRKAIDAINGPMPEDLPSAPSIRKMIEEHNRKKKRTLKAKGQQQDQPSLFNESEER